MRIDHVVTTLGAGGAESLVTGLAVEQAKMGHQVGVWTMFEGLADSQDLQKRRIADLASVGVEVRRIGTGPRGIPRAALGLRRGLRNSPADDRVIHCHSAATATAATLGSRGVPLVLTVHNTDFNFPAPLWRVVVRQVSAVVAVSDGAAKAFSLHSTKPIRVIENGIDLAASTENERSFDSARVSILAVGNLRPQKNYSRLLSTFREAVPEFGEAGLEVELSIAGDGEQRAILEDQVVDLGLADTVHLLGVRNDVARLMSESDIFVMSSDHEGQPIALLEALSAGLPCVVTPFASAGGVLKDGEVGRIAADFTVEALATALVETIRDPELRQRYSEAGMARANDYSIHKCALDYQDVYESVA